MLPGDPNSPVHIAQAGAQNGKDLLADNIFNGINLSYFTYVGNTNSGNNLPPAETVTTQLTEDDYKQAAAQLGCEVAAVKAVVEVESSGSGFLPNNLPKILFEGHIFRGKTNGQYDQTNPTISYLYSDPNRTNYYKGGEAEYSRLEEAISLDREAALESASWGLFQIMGFNYGACGFANVEDFVSAMKRSAGAQLSAFITYIKNQNLAGYLRNHQWDKFASSYNGPDYASNNYDGKLKDAYEKYA